MRIHTLIQTAVFSTAVLFSHAAFAQSYPSKPINLVVPYPAGGASDFAARVMSKDLSNTFKQPVLVDNVSGVSGALGTAKVAAALPDGYNILLSSPIELILTPIAMSAVKYKSEDLRAVAITGQAQIMLVVRKDLPVSNIEELAALAKKSVDKPLSYCTIGIGSPYHLMGERFAAITGSKSLHLPYNGFAQCVTNLVGQIVDYAFLPIAGPFPGFVDNGNIKVISIAANSPSPRFPKVPLASSSKGFEGFSYALWAGVHVGAKVPDDIVAVLNKAVNATMTNPEIRKAIEATGSTIGEPMTPAQAQAFYVKETAMYREIAKSINLQQQ